MATSDPSIAPPPPPPSDSSPPPSPPTATTATPARPKRPTCLHCPSPAKIKRSKNSNPLCIPHFLSTFETEILHTIQSTSLFHPGETIAIGASGGKDSTVLASVLTTLNKQYNLGLNLHLLSIDEGIVGYRDHSLATVKRNAEQYNLPLTILSYKDLYGWTMDSIVSTIGKKSNCTYCGVFRRQALDRGCELLKINHVVTGHNADDMAETVLMNLLRGDLPRLGRCTAITTQSEGGTIRRSKPMKYAYQKEIVLYAHHRKLDYFTTECTYAPEAFRGSARDLIKGLERIRPSAILDVVRSGEALAGLLGGAGRGGRGRGGGRREEEKDGADGEGKCREGKCACAGEGHEPPPTAAEIIETNTNIKKTCLGNCSCKSKPAPTAVDDDDDSPLGTCGSTASSGGEMHLHEARLRALEISSPSSQPHDDLATEITSPPPKIKTKPKIKNGEAPRKQQVLRRCNQCGYLSSQELCQACVMLKGLNGMKAKLVVEIEE